MTRERRAEITFGAGLLGFVVIAAVLAEGLLQLRAAQRYDWVDFNEAVMIEDEALGFMRFRPGTSYDQVSVNSLGLPGPEVALPKGNETLRLAFIGDSTVLGADLTEPQRVPAQVSAEVAAAFPNCSVDWINVSGPSYGFVETTAVLSDVQGPAEPDVYIIMLGGLNEAMRALEERAAPERSYFRAENPLIGASLLLTNLNKAYEALRRSRGQTGPDLMERVDLALFSEVFEAHVTGLADLIGDAPTVLVENRGRERDTMDAVAMALLRRTLLSTYDGLDGQGLITLRGLMRQTLGTVADDRGWTYIDPLSELPPTNQYFDGALHFTAEGISAVAPDIAESVVAQIRAAELGLSCLD